MQQWAVLALVRLEMTLSEDRHLSPCFLQGDGVSLTYYDEAMAWISKCFPAGQQSGRGEVLLLQILPLISYVCSHNETREEANTWKMISIG